MNIFKTYKELIINITKKNSVNLKIKNINYNDSIVVETPPPKFNFDLSCNICLILGKENNIEPKNLANNLKKILLKELNDISDIEIAGPGFLNISLNKDAIKKIILKICKDRNNYGSSKENNK